MKTAKVLFYASLSCVILLGLSFLIMKPVTLSGNEVLITALGIVFWILLILSIVFGFMAAAMVKKNVEEEKWRSMLPGIISFFKSDIAKIADIAFAVSLILVIVSVNTQLKYSYAVYVFLLVLTVSFGMHCLYNGKAYRLFSSNNKEQKKTEVRDKNINKNRNKREKYNGKH